MRRTLVAMTLVSAALLYADRASPQMAVGSVRVSADRLPMPGEDTTNYWGIGGGTAGAASRVTDRGTPKPDEKPRVEDGRK